MKAFLTVLTCLLGLSGCWATLPTEVKVAVPVACIKPGDVLERPPLVKDTELRAATRGERVYAARRYQELAEPYMDSLERAVKRCSTIPK
jgi:hypothetical protein